MARLASLLALLLAWLYGFPVWADASNLPAIKLTTSQTGLHGVSADSLATLVGLTSEAVRSRILQGQFTLLHQGQALGWLPASDGSQLRFHAEARHNNYTDQNVYWLVDGANQPPTPVDGGAPAGQTNGYYFARTNFEQDIYCEYQLASNPDSNYWFWANLVASHPFRGSFTSAFALEGLAPTNVTAWLTVRVSGATTTNHAVALTLNGVTNAAWIGVWSNLQPAEFTFAVPSALLSPESNSVTFTALGNFASQWWLAGWQLAYPHPYGSPSGRLVCGANSNAVVTLTGFRNPAVTVLDVTQPLAPLWVTNLALESVAGAWNVSFAPLQPGDCYSVCQAGAELAADAMEAVWPVGLASPTNRAAFVLIAPTNLLAAAQPLADYRLRQGLETKLVSLESVYNEFNGGLREPVAIGNFLAYAWQQWTVKPAYALLVGNGTYDYRNRFGAGDNLVPPLMVPTLYGLAASDSAYGQVVSAVGPQIAVGRLPVTNAAQLAACVAKLEAYENTPVSGRLAVLLADLADPAAGDFPADLGRVQAALASAFTPQMILPANTGSNTALMRTLLLSNLNTGADLFCYLGHGAAQMLGDSGYLATADVPSLTNGNRLPLVSAVTCLAGFYAQPGYDCLAQALVLPAESGAIAVFSGSGFSLDAEATELNLGLMSALASGTPGRLGDFVRQAMVSYNQAAHFTPTAMYNLLGDPTLRFRGSPAPAPLPPRISNLSPNGEGGMKLTLSAQPSQHYVLAATTNLALPGSAWTVVSAGTVPFGPFSLTDLAATNFAQRFYQLRTQPQ
jgi:hypothetical protein